MSKTEILKLDEIEDLALKALVAAGTSKHNAASLARATAATEADGIASHGLAYIPIYCEHVQCGKVDGNAEPTLEQPRPGIVRVDAATGFAHPAIDRGFEALIPAARIQGVAALGIYNSYNCGVLGYHTYRLAQEGLVALGFTNAPASIAPVGANKPAVGTNPFSIATPSSEPGGEPDILIDQSSSAIAKSEVMKHAREGKNIPLGWALDADGNPTTDPALALKGSMAPSGGYKGVGVALLVEIMAAALTGANLGIHAAPFSGTEGGAPKTGQFFLAIDPNSTANGSFFERIGHLTGAFRDQKTARIPGESRRANRLGAREKGVCVNVETLTKIRAIVSDAPTATPGSRS